MKIAYFDAPSGISGNMILGSLIDAGLEPATLKKKLSSIAPGTWELIIKKIKKKGFGGTHLEVEVYSDKPHRTLPEVLEIIQKSQISKRSKELSSNIFRRLAQAEAKVHGELINQVHFHDVGAIDAIIDIVGAVVGLEILGIEKIFCSPLPNGKGKIVHAHGLLTNPAPATAELLKGFPTYGNGIRGELVTPTGAAIITTLAESFGDIPRMKISNIGYGAGTIELPIPNLLRVFIGEAQIPARKEAILQIEANIDDMEPKLYPNAIASLMKAGALDAYVTPIQMKKGRSAINLIALTTPEKKDQVLEVFFMETTTFGARTYLVSREILSRKFIYLKTKYGKVKTKVGSLGKKMVTVAPEFEECRRIAAKHRLPVSKIYLAAKSAICSSSLAAAASTKPRKRG